MASLKIMDIKKNTFLEIIPTEKSVFIDITPDDCPGSYIVISLSEFEKIYRFVRQESYGE